MKTPCQADPELWVSESVKDRREAAQECKTCPAIAWCLEEIVRVEPTHGVWAGVDYSKTDALRPTHVTAMTKPCEVCEEPFERTYQSQPQWDAQRFCSNNCSSRRFRKETAA